jgi:hypothetical protein
VVGQWFIHDTVVKIIGIEYCNDDSRMKAVARQFARASNGLFSGCIGALDGWVVKNKRPSKKDGISNPKSFYSRKGFFAVNVQAIVDKTKRFRSIISCGAEQDSTAFKNSGLYKWLLENLVSLACKGFYFSGNSAYLLKSFILTPGTEEVLIGNSCLLGNILNFFCCSHESCILIGCILCLGNRRCLSIRIRIIISLTVVRKLVICEDT